MSVILEPFLGDCPEIIIQLYISIRKQALLCLYIVQNTFFYLYFFPFKILHKLIFCFSF